MPRDERLFGDVTSPSVSIGHHQGTSVMATILLELALASALVVAPLFVPDVLPPARETLAAFVAPPEMPPPPPPPRGQSRPQAAEPAPAPAAQEAAPTEAPEAIHPEVVAPPAGPDIDGFRHVGPPGVPDGIVGSVGPEVIQPPPPVPKPTPQPVGGRIRPPKKVRHVAPVYPEPAIRARIDGPVLIEAVIDESGRVVNATVLSGRPFLDQAALEAVRQWEFTPTLLNGAPTPVIMTVTVSFSLR